MKALSAWRNAWRDPVFRSQTLVSLPALFVALLVLRLFLEYAGTRTGVVLPDPFVSLLPPVEMQWITFSLIYSGILLGVVSLCLDPSSFLLALRALVLLIALRIVCGYLLPLDPPAGVIPLDDPIVPFPIVRPAMTRDLFFSWETAIMTLLALTARWKDLRIIFTCTAVVISLLLLLQHVHYTVDVVAAPCFAYVAYGFARRITTPGLSEILPGGLPR